MRWHVDTCAANTTGTDISRKRRRARAAIRPVHTGVAGRLRFHVVSLYRSERVRDSLERDLAGLPGIRSVRANVLTANVLVVFAPERPVEEILQLIADTLGLVAEPLERSPAADTAEVSGFGRRVAAVSGVLRWRNLLFWGTNGGDYAYDAQADGGETAPGGHDFHSWILEAIAAEFEPSYAHGLSEAEAERRRLRYGANRLPEPEARSELGILFEQFNSLPVALLSASAVTSLVTGGLFDAAVIMGVVAINAVIGFVTERQAERTINALTASAPQNALVLRNGSFESTAMATLVPGDILFLKPGSFVAADARLLQADQLTLDESALTGESMPVIKDAGLQLNEDTPLAERRKMAYMGTVVTGGTGRGVVVAAVPEGLPAVATTTLARGIRELRRHNVAVRHLDAVENRGSVQVFCLDKTGTHTRNHMTVTAACAGERYYSISGGRFIAGGELVDTFATPELQRLLELACLCSETVVTQDGGSLNLEGSPTESALVELAVGSGLDVRALREQRPVLDVIHRAEGRPMMTTIHELGGERRLLVVKGSPREVLSLLCRRRLRGGRRMVLSERDRERILLQNDVMAGDALRVLGVAYAETGPGRPPR
jgi:Ca2+-transporting ATPase